MKKFLIILIFFLSTCFVKNLYAATVYLTDGQKIEGKVFQEADGNLRIELSDGQILNVRIKDVGTINGKIYSSSDILNEEPKLSEGKNSKEYVVDNKAMMQEFLEAQKNWIPSTPYEKFVSLGEEHSKRIYALQAENAYNPNKDIEAAIEKVNREKQDYIQKANSLLSSLGQEEKRVFELQLAYDEKYIELLENEQIQKRSGEEILKEWEEIVAELRKQMAEMTMVNLQKEFNKSEVEGDIHF